MAKVHIVQYLCHNRHLLVMAAYEEGAGTFDEAVSTLKESMESRLIDARCELCGSEEMRFEDGVTAFTSLAEAHPWFLKAQADNLLTRVHLATRLRSARN